jgi:hypothetical protein
MRMPSKAGMAWTVILAGALVLGIVLGQVFVPHRAPAHRTAYQRTPERPSRPTVSAADAQTQARNIDELLASGKKAHARLQYDAGTCDGLAAAVPDFKRIVSDRQRELTDAETLPLDRLPGAADLRKALTDTYRSALSADLGYLAWAKETDTQDCGSAEPPDSSYLVEARAADDQAGPAKRRLVRLWNPIARGQGLPAYDWSDL